MKRLYTLDEMEENTAVLTAQDGKCITVPREMLASGVKEGMLVAFSEEMGLYCPQKAATAQRQQQMRSRVEQLLAKSAEQKK